MQQCFVKKRQLDKVYKEFF